MMMTRYDDGDEHHWLRVMLRAVLTIFTDAGEKTDEDYVFHYQKLPTKTSIKNYFVHD